MEDRFPDLSFWALLTNVSHQPSIKNVKLTSLKWNTVVFRARDAAKRDALAYEMHLVIPLATGMEKVHWVKWEQIAFILYLESYSRHWVTDAPSQTKTSFLHIWGSRRKLLFFWFQWESAGVLLSLLNFFLYFSANFLLGHLVTMTKCPKVCVLRLFGEVWGHSSVWTQA